MSEMIRTGSSARKDWPVAVVIGAGGIGLAVARRLGQRHRLIVASQSGDKDGSRQAMLAAEGHDVAVVACDITDPASVAALAQRVQDTGDFAALAHVAALSPSMGDWRTLLRVNLIGPALIEAAMLPLARQGSAAIFVSSLAAHMVNPPGETLAILDHPLTDDFIERLEAAVTEPQDSTLAYCLTKYAMNRMCRRFATRWGAVGARIVSMSPGLIATPMGAREFAYQPQKLDLLNRTPLRREGTMLEMADAVEFLASDRASFITGTDLLVDGGTAAKGAFPDEA